MCRRREDELNKAKVHMEAYGMLMDEEER